MTAPTREQIEAAREWLAMALKAAHGSPLPFVLGEDGQRRLVTLLAATAPPTDAELDAEGIAWLKRKRTEESVDVRAISRTEAYIAGARREGRR